MLLSTALMQPSTCWRKPGRGNNGAAGVVGNAGGGVEEYTMTKPRPLPAPTGHAISLTRAAFFHARVGDTHALCCVLDRGVSADARNERGQTLLHIACSNRRFDAARLLLERGADPELPSQLGFTPLTTAAVDADDRLTALLLDHGADPDGTGPEGLTALMLAAMLDRVELVALLLERGASLELALADGSTALSMALRVDAHCAAQLLLAMSSVNNSRRADQHSARARRRARLASIAPAAEHVM